MCVWLALASRLVNIDLDESMHTAMRASIALRTLYRTEGGLMYKTGIDERRLYNGTLVKNETK